jgi:hypothetical protein
MVFYVGGEQVWISVNKYRNNDAASHPTPADGGTQDALSIKDALMGLDMSTVLGRAGGAQSYVDVFTGKGNPDAITEVLKMFYDYSAKFIALHANSPIPVRKRCAGFLADPNLSWQDSLQAICDEVIGLDCNGFVGNWLKTTDYTLKLGPQQGPRDVYNARRQQRMTVGEIEYCDICVWANFSHIAAIEDVAPGGSPKFNICQSAGGGPRMNEYSILQAGAGTFTLSGGYPAGDVAGPVYIISPWS